MLSISHGVSIMAEPHPDRGVPAGGISTSRPIRRAAIAGAIAHLSEAAPAPPSNCRAGFGS
jgi:hypothetical protein